jgi:drug/metabolite transporter (DMT)-like permease
LGLIAYSKHDATGRLAIVELMKSRFVILLVGMNLLWAPSYPIFKSLLTEMSAGSLATIRFSLAAITLLAAWPWVAGKGPRLSDLPRVALMGVIVFGLAPRLQIEGVRLGQAGDTSLLIALDPLIMASAAALFLRERVPARRWWGCALGMVGVVLLSRVWWGEATPMHGLLANSLVIASFACEAAYSVLGKPLLDRCSALKILAAGAVMGTIANAGLDLTLDHGSAFAAIQTISARAWLLIIYLTLVCTILGYWLWFVVLRETELNITGLTVLVQPMVGLLISVLWLGERLHSGQLWGSVAIVAGLMVGLRSNGENKRAVVGELGTEPLAKKPVLVEPCP